MGSEENVNASESDGREYPKRPVASLAVCVFRDNRILLIKRATPPSLGQWSVPGGVIELGETFEDTAKREIDEECGIEIDVGKVFDVENFMVLDDEGRIQYHYVVTYMTAYHAGGEARPGPEAMDVRWVTKEELSDLDMNPIVRRVMLEAFNNVTPGD